MSAIESKARRALKGSAAEREKNQRLVEADAGVSAGKFSKRAGSVMKKGARLIYKCAVVGEMRRIVENKRVAG